ncbi:MAG: hypothetical protein KDA52_14665 [Planctomycetaceae bacterium]|nr:hypothetical protein [Planctomycetaceae bacterium]
MTDQTEQPNEQDVSKSRKPSRRRLWGTLALVLLPILGLLWVSNWFYQRSRLFSVTNIDLELGEPELPWGLLIGENKARELFGDPIKYHLSEKTLTPYQIGILGGYTGLRSLELRGVTDADVRNLKGLTNLEGLALSDSPITDKACEIIGQFENLQRLFLGNFSSDSTTVQITDDGLKHLGHLKNLQTLGLGDYYTDSTVQITDDGLRHLVGLTQLRNLGLHSPRVTDDGFKTISQLQSLESLLLDGRSLSGEDLSDLPNLPNLQNLHISNWSLKEHALSGLPKLGYLSQLSLWHCSLSENCLRPIGDCPLLERFSLEGSRLSENLSLQPLAECPFLIRLFLNETNATDAMLEDLTSCRSLEGLYLNHTQVSHEACERFHRSHPGIFMTDATGYEVGENNPTDASSGSDDPDKSEDTPVGNAQEDQL